MSLLEKWVSAARMATSAACPPGNCPQIPTRNKDEAAVAFLHCLTVQRCLAACDTESRAYLEECSVLPALVL